eukprot:TRINITY_DN5032_c0_g1_i1.p1 TRINITY_DN5032_c0_g1~~TRINITY_DN5032_c0_g1_i1.p1  ORF type:complete len:845 (-),score=173.23 TRINITY_DN5032_c0_g1_i1:151-2358(-)
MDVFSMRDGGAKLNQPPPIDHEEEQAEANGEEEVARAGKARQEKVGSKRKRAQNIACLQCRKGHLKCDGSHPCSNCVKRKKDECTFISPRKRGPKSKELREQLERLEKENARQRKIIEMYKAQSRAAVGAQVRGAAGGGGEKDFENVLANWLSQEEADGRFPLELAPSYQPVLGVELPPPPPDTLGISSGTPPSSSTSSSSSSTATASSSSTSSSSSVPAPAPSAFALPSSAGDGRDRGVDGATGWLSGASAAPSMHLPFISDISEAEVAEYLNHYFVSIHPFFNILNPDDYANPARILDHLQTYPTPAGQSAFGAQYRIILAISCRLMGNPKRADALVQQAMTLLGPLLPNASIPIARVLLLLSYFYCGFGDGSQSRYYNAIAYHMSGMLQHPDGAVLRKCLLTMALCEEDCNVRHRLFEKLERDVSPSVPERLYDLFILIAGDVSLRVSPSDSIALLRKLRECERNFELIESSGEFSESVVVTTSMLMFSARAIVYDYLGMREVGLEWAEKTTGLLRYPFLSQLFFGVIPAIAIATRLQWNGAKMNLVYENLKALYILSSGSYLLAAQLIFLASKTYNIKLGSIGISIDEVEGRLKRYYSSRGASPPDALVAGVGGKFDIVDHALRNGFGASTCVTPQEPSHQPTHSKHDIQSRLEFACFGADKDRANPETPEQANIASHSAVLAHSIESILQEVEADQHLGDEGSFFLGGFNFSGEDEDVLLPELFDLVGPQ